MQKSTHQIHANGTIQSVMAFDAELTLCTAFCGEDHIIKTALRTSPEAFLAPVCLP